MKKSVMITILIFLIFIGISDVQADVVWTEGYHELNIGDSHEQVNIYNDVHLNIFGGGIGYLDTFNTSLSNWFDGSINYLRVYDFSHVNIYGGELGIVLGSEDSGSINLYQSSFIKAVSLWDNAILNLYAKDIIHGISGGSYNDGWIEGRYVTNDQFFHIDIIQDSFAHINIVPEPATALLLGLGGLVILRRKKL